MSKLLDAVREAVRTRHYSIRTEEAYLRWIREYILFFDRECLNHSRKWRRVFRVLAFSKLACVVAAHEQVNGSRERVDTTREAARAARQPR